MINELNLLASCLPRGILSGIWTGKNIEGSNLRNFLKGFSIESSKVISILNQLKIELSLWNTTDESIELWEHLVGIPDNVFIENPYLLSLDERIKNVSIKLFGYKISTKSQLKNLLQSTIPELNGVNIEIINATKSNTTPFTTPLFLISKSKIRNTIIIKIPQALTITSTTPFETPFITGLNDIPSKIKKIVKYFIPFNCQVIVYGA